ncbi:hypothetical protein Dimus_026058 [Dionaea muscipula]
MATYYTTSSTQVDVLSAPYVPDQKFAPYTETPLLNGSMMMYLNPAASAGSLSSGISVSAQNCVEIPSIAGRNEVMFIPPNGGPMSVETNNWQLNGAATDAVGSTPLTSRRQLGMADGEQNLQGLSLSLSSKMSTAMPNSQFQYTYANPGLTSLLSSHLPLAAENGCGQVTAKIDASSQCKELRTTAGYVSSYDIHADGENSIRFRTPNGIQYPTNPKVVNSNPYQYEQAGLANAILKSKYLKAAQLLLDEVVSVAEALKLLPDSRKDQNTNKPEEGSKVSKGKSMPASDAEESAHELSAAEQQDLQNKLDKLLAMLDEVDRRYRQYYHQMQILVASFDMVAGNGAAKPYSALALKTISRHFRSLRDAISNQILVTRKNLGEQDPANGQGGGGSILPRLGYIDQQLRQRQALQQFGMMRHAWRPQRGLPESAVSVLRAWLFEHFLHPYPKDSEKIMLARQTGLTRTQVANWFINARVRLWKPMVEEMYKEEFDDADVNFKLSSSPDNNTPKGAREKSWASEDKREDLQQESETNSMATDHDLQHGGQRHDSRTNIKYHDSGLSERGLPFNNTTHGDDDDIAKNYGFMMRLPGDLNGDGSLMITAPAAAYQVPALGSFMVDNQVSLALGLRNGTTEATATAEYPYLDPVNQQRRFSNLHLLNNFVA